MKKPIKSLTVKELMEALEGMDPDLPVMFAYNYGDHGRTEVAASIDTLEEMPVQWSDYHRMHKVMGEDQSEADISDFVVIIRGR